MSESRSDCVGANPGNHRLLFIKIRRRAISTLFPYTTLFRSPAGESVLIDCGNPGTRDAERIHKVATRQAGLKAIDHLIITHWHSDHYGGVAHLTRLMPVRHFYDHGIPETLEDDPKGFPLLIQAYKTA